MKTIFKSLARRINGDVHTGLIQRQMLATDGSIFQVRPAAVVYPKCAEDVAATVLFANRHGLSVHPRGAGSGLCGSAIGKGIVVDFTRYMNRLLRIDYANKWFECEPGFRLGELEAALRGKSLFFPPDPSSGEYATFGGMYATNASGARSVKYGNVSDYVIDARIVLGSGRFIKLSGIRNREFQALPENLRGLFSLYVENAEKIETAYPHVRYNSAGYNLKGLVRENRLCLEKLFAGAEGTLGIATRLKFRLEDKPADESLVVAFSADIVDSATAVQKILPMGPSAIEIMDKSLLGLAGETDLALKEKIPSGIDNVLLIEFDSDKRDECVGQAEKAREILRKDWRSENVHLAVSASEKAKFVAVRKTAVPILYRLKGRKKILALIEDAAVPTDRLVDYFRGIYTILDRHKVRFVTYGHIAKGLLHTRPLLDLKDANDVAMLRLLADDIFDLVHSLGGAVSGEHGDGRLRSAYIRKQYPEIHRLFLETKRLLDENNVLNPEIKTVHDPAQMTKNLRYGPDYRASDSGGRCLEWPEGFATEIEKCHGCSKCATITTATRMCPVYKFTRDEAAAPKAKANVLRALISGAVDENWLFDDMFRRVIDYCVNCGSCHKECPSGVNIPKMAIEARSRYVRRHGPALHDRIVTGVEFGAKTVRKFSAALRPVMESGIVRKAGERFAGISARREFVPFSAKSLYERTAQINGSGPIIILYFAGCYASYIRPEIGEAAIRIMKRMGMTVWLPPHHCCGLPLLSKGMAKQAKAKVRQNLGKWGELAKTADHIVVTCSSCGHALMTEWPWLSDGGPVKTTGGKIFHISRLVRRYMNRLEFENRGIRICYHQPCHLKVQPEPASSPDLLSRISGIEVEHLNTHCCGMAGTMGFSEKHFDLSRKIGADLISKLNHSNAGFGVTDCPTCRMQMEQFGNKPVRHPVEILDKMMKCHF